MPRLVHSSWPRLSTAISELARPPLAQINLPQRPGCVAPPVSPWVYVFLLLLCLVPRVWMACDVRYICPDATNYVHAAEAIESHSSAPELGSIKFNTLTLGMVALHRLGFDLETAGQIWNVCFSTLAILPLFGWTRRQFDNRIGFLSAVLYAVHPGLVENTAEVIRDPSFWFFFLLTLYVFWRAIAESRYVLFAIGGVTAVLAVFTRFEGFALAIPFCGWMLAAWRSGASSRRRLLIGGTLATGVAPTVLVLASVVLLPNAQPSKLVRLDPLVRVEHWLHTWRAAPDPTWANAPSRFNEPAANRPLSKLFVTAIVRGFDPAFLLLIPASLMAWRGLWLRRDVIPLVLMAAAVLFASWVHLSYAHVISSRYALPLFLAVCPLCALGLSWPAERRLTTSLATEGKLILSLTLLLSVIGLVDALGSSVHGRAEQAELGRWIGQQYGWKLKISSPADGASVLNYYARGSVQSIRPGTPDEQLLPAILIFQPEVVILRRSSTALEEKLLAARQLDLHPLPDELLPRSAKIFHILLKGEVAQTAALRKSLSTAHRPGQPRDAKAH